MLKKILIVSLLTLIYQKCDGFKLYYTSHSDQSICSSLYETNQDNNITKDGSDSNSDFCVTTSIFPLTEGLVEAIVDTQTPQDVEISLLVHKITEERNVVVVAKETKSWTSREVVIKPEIRVEVSANSVDGYVTLLVRASDASSLAVESISFLPVTPIEDDQLVVPITDEELLDEVGRTLNPPITIAFPTVSDITITPAPITIQFPNVSEIITQPPQTPINTVPFPTIGEIVTQPPINTIPFPNVTEIVTQPPETPINTVPFPTVGEIDIPTPATDAPTEDEEPESPAGLSTVAIVMVAIGSAVGVGIIAFALWYFICKP